VIPPDMPQLRFSTSTLHGEEVVPWLASAGELAYSPYSPPDRDYYFQYSWVIPGIFHGGTKVRRHFWFGCPFRDHREVKLLFTFWNRARQGELDTLFVSNGRCGLEDATAPLAVYRHSDVNPCARERVIFMQHGSYLIADMESQPHIDRGEAVLYRGLQKAEVFLLRRLITADVRRRLMRVHARTLADSVTSFNAMHCNVSRTETGWFNDRTFLLSDLCREAGLEPKRPIRSLLYSAYALEEWCAVRKFGPNYVKLRTPLSNIRITTFVCSETEVKVIDPNKLDVIEAVGCRVRESRI
jgi:hypothetical protein